MRTGRIQFELEPLELRVLLSADVASLAPTAGTSSDIAGVPGTEHAAEQIAVMWQGSTASAQWLDVAAPSEMDDLFPADSPLFDLAAESRTSGDSRADQGDEAKQESDAGRNDLVQQAEPIVDRSATDPGAAGWNTPGTSRDGIRLASPGGGALDFSVVGFLDVHVGSYTIVTNPGADDPYAVGHDTTLSFKALPGFPNFAVESIALYRSGASVDGFVLTDLHLPFAGSLALAGQSVVQLQNPALEISRLSLLNGTASGSLGLVADGATLLPGASGLSVQVQDAGDGGRALVGIFDLVTGDLSMAAEKFSLVIPGALEVSAQNANFSFKPGADLTQELLQLPHAEAKLTALGGIAATLDGVHLRANGFSIDTSSISVPDISIGGFLTVHTPKVSLEGISYTVGGPFLGQFGLGAPSANIALPGGLTVAITDGLDALDLALDGSFALATKTLHFGADQVQLAIPGLLDLSAASLGIDYNPFGAIDQPLFSFGSINIGLVPLNVQIPVVGLHVRLNGFSLDDQLVPQIPDVSLGSFLSLPHPDLGFNGINFSLGTPLLGSLDLKALGGSLTLGTGFSAAITDGLDALDLAVDGSLDLSTGKFHLGLDQLALSVPSLLTASASGVALNFDPKGAIDQPLLALGQLNAEILPLGVSAQVTGFDLRANGFSLGNSAVVLPTITVGDFLTLETPTLTFGNVSYTTGGPLLGTLGLGAGVANLHLGTGLSAVIVDGPDSLGLGIDGTYTLETKRFHLGVDQIQLHVPDILDASGSSLSLDYDPSGALDQLLLAAPSLSARLVPLGLDLNLQGLKLRRNGFSIDTSSISVPDLSIGGFLTIQTPTVTMNGIGYTVGGPFLGQFGLGAPSANIALPGGLAVTITDGLDALDLALDGSFALATKTFHFGADQVQLAIPGLLDLSAASLGIDYNPFGAIDQPLFSFGSINIGLVPLNVQIPVVGLHVRLNGFSLDDQLVPQIPDVSLGSFLSLPHPDLGFNGINFSLGTPLLGSLDLKALGGSLTLGTGFSATITDGLDALDLAVDGSLDLSTGKFHLGLDQLALSVPSLLTASASGVALNFDPKGAIDQPLLAFGQLNAEILPLGVSAQVTSFDLRANGFSLGNSAVVLPTITVGDFLTLETPTLTFGNLRYTVGAGPVLGTLGLSTGSGRLTIGTQFTADLTDGPDDLGVALSGTYSLETRIFDLAIDQIALQSPGLFTASGAGIAVHFDPAGVRGQEIFVANHLSATLIPLGGVTATLDGLHVRQDGFAIANAVLNLPDVRLGTLATLVAPSLTFRDVVYTEGQPLAGQFGLTANTATLFPDRSYTASITDGTDSNTTGVEGYYDLASAQFHLNVDLFRLEIPQVIVAQAAGVVVNYDPAGGDNQVVATIGLATLTFPRLQVSGQVQAMTLRPNGFFLGSASLAYTETYSLGRVTFKGLGIQLTEFGVTYATGATFNGSITVFTSSASVLASSNVTAVISDSADDADVIGLGATFDFSDGNFGGLVFTADVLDITLGGFLQLTGRHLLINATAGLGDIVLQVDSIGASLPRLGIGGQGGGFAIRADGSLLTLPGFGFSFSFANLQIGSLQWPSWFPIQVTEFGLRWADFELDPGNFQILLSAAALPLPSLPSLSVTGSINGLVLDIGLLKLGKFPVIQLGSIAINVSGSLFGGTIDGGFALGLLRLDAQRHLIPDGNLTTPVVDIVPYGSINAGYSFAGLLGIQIQFGLSALGPLLIYVRADRPVLLNATTGLTLTGFRGGVSFNDPLPTITDPLQLRDQSFASPVKLTASQWLDRLQNQVLAQYRAGDGEPLWIEPPQEMRILAGATLFSSYTTTETFHADVDIAISTTGQFLITGTAVFANNLEVNAKFYADLSKPGRTTIFFLADTPSAPSQTLTLRGELEMESPDPNTFVVRLKNGGVDLKPAGLLPITISGQAELNITVKPVLRLALNLSGTVSIAPLGEALRVAGTLVVQARPPPSGSIGSPVDLWGVLAIQTTLGGLADLGLNINATVLLQLNTTTEGKTLTATLPGSSPTQYRLQPLSYRVAVSGSVRLELKGTEVLSMTGTFDMELSARGRLTVLANGTLFLGASGMRFLKFGFRGYFQIDQRGVAGQLDVDLDGEYRPSSTFNLDFTANFQLIFNTTGEEVRYRLPDSGTQDTANGGGRLIVIPGDEAYVRVTGSGFLEVGPFRISGGFSLSATPTSIDLEVDGSMALTVQGSTLMSFQVEGGLRINGDGIAAGISLHQRGTLPSSARFKFAADTTFRLEVNTTGKHQTLPAANGSPAVSLESGTYFRVRIDGSLVVAGLSLDGYFLLTVGPNLLQLEANATISLLIKDTVILKVNASGGFQWDNRGLAAAIQLTLKGALPDRDGYKLGSLDESSLRLEVNTTNREVTLGTSVLDAGIYARVIVGARLTVGDVFKLDGTFLFSVGTNRLNVAVDASLSLVVGSTRLFAFDVDGSLSLEEDGIVGVISLALAEGGGLPASLGAVFDVSFRLDINSTSADQVVRLGSEGVSVAANTFRVFAEGTLDLSAFHLDGTFSIVATDDGFKAEADAQLDLFGGQVQLTGNLIFSSNGLAALISLEVPSVETDYFALSGTFSLQINTATTGPPKLGVPRNTYLIKVKDAELTIAGVTLTGSLSVGVSNGKLYLDIPESDPLTFNFLNRFAMSVYGTIAGKDFSLTGETTVTLGSTSLAAFKGTLSLTLTNHSASAQLSGRAWLLGYDAAAASGSLNIDAETGDYSASLWISFSFTQDGVLDISGSGLLSLGTRGVSIGFTANAKLFHNNSLNMDIAGNVDTATGHYYLYGSASFFAGSKVLGIEGGVGVTVANYSDTIYVGDTLFGTPVYKDIESGFTARIYGSVWIAGVEAISASAEGGSSGKFTLKFSILGVPWTVHVDLNNGFDVWKSDLAGSTVFLDVNGNGALDAGEPSTQADQDGTFNFADESVGANLPTTVPLGILARFDTNKNGRLGAAEGRFVIRGGTYLDTGKPLIGDLFMAGADLGQPSSVGNAVIFFDADLNGVKDSKEAAASIDAAGNYRFLATDPSASLGSLAPYDLNNNGVLETTEGRLRVLGGTRTDPITGLTIPGDQIIDNSRLVGYTAAQGAQRVFFDANRNGRYDTGEASVVPDADNFYSFIDLESEKINDLGRLRPFDTNGNGVIDGGEGQFVILGGTDRNTGLANAFSIPMSAEGYGGGFVNSASPYSQLLAELKKTGYSPTVANRRALIAFGLPTQIQLDTYVPRRQGSDSAYFNGLVLRGSEQLNVLTAVGTAVFGSTVSVSAAQSALAASLASVIRGLGTPTAVTDASGNQVYPAQLDLGDATVVRQILAGAASRLQVTPSNGTLNASSRIIAGLNRRINAIAASPVASDLITALASVKGLAETDAAATVRAVVAGTTTSSDAIADYSDANILTKIGARQLPPFIRQIDTQESTGAAFAVPVRLENPNGNASDLIVRLSSDSPNIVPASGLVLIGTGKDRTLNITPVPGHSGNATVTVEVEVRTPTGGRLISSESFKVKVRVPNLPPTVSPVAPQRVETNGTTGLISFQISDPDTPLSGLTVTAVSSNTALLDASGIQLGGSGANRTLKLSPKTDQSGIAVVRIVVTDGVEVTSVPILLKVKSKQATPSVTVSPNPEFVDPTAGNPPGFVVPEGSRVQLLNLALADTDTPVESLTIKFASDNPAVLGATHFQVTGSGASRAIWLNLPTGRTGVALVDLVVSDGTKSIRRTLRITVRPVNQPPSFAVIPDQFLQAGVPLRIPLAIADADTDPAQLKFAVTSSDDQVVPEDNLRIEGTGLTQFLVIGPGTLPGVARLSVSVSDGQLARTRTFGVNVVTPAGAPVLSDLANQVVGIGESTPTIPFHLSDPTRSASELVVSMTSSNPTLVPDTGIVLIGFGASRSLVVTSAQGQVGTTNISVTVSNGVLATTKTFQLKVEANAFEVDAWTSTSRANNGVGLAELPISENGQFVESRASGVSELRVKFSATLDPRSLDADDVTLSGRGADGRALDLSGIEISLGLANNDRTLVLRLSRPLPDQGLYQVTLSGVASASGSTLSGVSRRTFSTLVGDLNGDRVVNDLDVDRLRALRGSGSVTASSNQQVRSDLNGDGRITNADLAGLTRLLGHQVVPVAGLAFLSESTATQRIDLPWQFADSFSWNRDAGGFVGTVGLAKPSPARPPGSSVVGPLALHPLPRLDVFLPGSSIISDSILQAQTSRMQTLTAKAVPSPVRFKISHADLIPSLAETRAAIRP
ncbi:MAG: hypothetical protein IT581_10625 [Verrucomicrobiales bacterium]|nr:hypothetical protein [Verrucomicrobiales bacterium]